jgi:hypothetical protein
MAPSYNYDFVCSYKDIETSLLQKVEEANKPDKEDKEEDTEQVYFVCEEIYRHEFLMCFHLVEYDCDVINSTVTELYIKCYKDPNFKLVLDFISEHMQEPDIEMCFMQLFSYHYLYVTQQCIRQLKHTQQLCDTLRNQLLNAYKTIHHLQDPDV